MGSFDGMAYAERQLLALSDEVSELGGGVAGVAAGHQTVAYGTRAAVTDDDYGRAFWASQGGTFAAVGDLLRFLSGKFHSEGENLGQARAVYRSADEASTIRGDI
ncbi:hypothetical protein [Streptosporangium lutulentum]|uniref:Excreted virulence factor EspC, type VII ESX diderm n=1 Tax=Streptosporangium lutulentum TaxID=1461250 RepID=A0ABT9QRE8_9ACTN|nr:hypothetical protein [Streptosporangium lutulentum]MDP9849327.1 hypothetical protein [Streptosporangium lutulentum]